MLLRRRFFVLAALFGTLALRPAAAQEFDCSVSVNYQTLGGNEYTFLQELEPQIEEYMNDRVWTEDRFEDVERIDCLMTVTIEEAVSLTSFRGRLIIASRRPIYGTTQSSVVVQFNDPDWRFNYAQGSPLVFDLDRYDPLTSVLDFYAYVMLGYDYDTFSELGGTAHFEQARFIADLAQSSGASGWNQLGSDQSRGELVEQILDPRFRRLRAAYYDYHYHGLDHFVTQTDEARARILGTLTGLQELYDEVARSYVLDLFFNAKYQELPAVFEQSQLSGQAYDILAQVDPAHLTEYGKMID